MKTALLLFLILPIAGWAQVVDDFSDGDFTQHPAWSGTDTSFIVNANKQLQSAATAAGEAWLATDIDEAVEWRFWIRENFSPSANNYAEVWLCSDTVALPYATRGYFLRFGAAGSQDAIELYRKSPDGEHLVCQGNAAAIASPFKVAVRVLRNAEGFWTLATDYENNGSYGMEASGVDSTYPVEGYFGFYLRFTSSNAKKFYFDDVYVGPEIIDTEAPELLGLEVVDNRHLVLDFSESLAETALSRQNYRIPEVGTPDSVTFEGSPSKVLLGFNHPLPENTNLTLHVEGVSDLSGNVMVPSSWEFSIYRASVNDVVINEIMADPSPVVGLPEWEYVELFNTTELLIDLKDWTLGIGNTGKPLPSMQIAPQEYLILCKDDAEQELRAYGATCGFSSFSIANAGAVLKLLNPEGEVISEVSFNDTWYHDPEKKEGGWALEQIDPFNPCAGTANWSASVDVSGGTPGRVNSINAPNLTAPKVERLSMSDDNTVLLWFDQQMDRATLAVPEHYRVVELDLIPSEVVVNPVTNTSVSLAFEYSFLTGVVYTLEVEGVESCSGHLIEDDTHVRFGIPNPIGEGDILINELLFDPIDPGVDYVELYNVSDKTIDLSTLKLGVAKKSFPNPTDTVLKPISEDSRLLLPHCYLLLSTDAFIVGRQYGYEIDNYVDMKSFPSYPNSGGVVLLMGRDGVVVDRMTYSEQLHYPLLKETKGVSLERVSWQAPSEQADNWHSAAESVGFGTPGYANSMMQTVDGEVEAAVRVLPEVFSPDGDGLDEHCVVAYDFGEPGNTMNVYVFSVDGRLVRHLVKGILVGTSGQEVWNGLDEQGRRVPIGLYVVVTEVFDLGGKVRKYKNVVAVASR